LIAALISNASFVAASNLLQGSHLGLLQKVNPLITPSAISPCSKQFLKIFISLGFILESFPKALFIYKLGNHDQRLEDYMINKAPELLDTEFWQIEHLLDFEKYNIVKVGSLDYIKLGKLRVVHGNEFRSGFIAPVNPARGLFLRTKESALQSHVHRTSEHTEKTLGGKVIVCYSIGCLSDLQPDYNRYNNYNLGFAMVVDMYFP